MADITVTTAEAVALLATAQPPVTARHIQEWARARRGRPPRIRPVGARGRSRLYAWSDLLRLERDTRPHRGHASRTSEDQVHSNRGR
ncbi:hypothetical protein AB1460_33785 [Parafrankia sp. FMc2]